VFKLDEQCQQIIVKCDAADTDLPVVCSYILS